MDYNTIKKPQCETGCFHYGMFANAGVCEALDSWGSIHEPVELGQDCLHPDKKEFGVDLGIFSFNGLCAALEGTIVVGGKEDNTQIVRLLTEKE